MSFKDGQIHLINLKEGSPELRCHEYIVIRVSFLVLNEIFKAVILKTGLIPNI